MRVIAECGGSPLLVNDHLNGYGLGLAVMKQGLLLNMRISGQLESHRALANVTTQGVFTWPSAKAVRALCHDERELRCGWLRRQWGGEGGGGSHTMGVDGLV